MNEEARLYTDLLIKCVSNAIYRDDLEMHAKHVHDKTVVLPHEAREKGMGWPSKAHSMAGIERLTNARDLAQQAIDEQIPGDFIETGVWRGGCSILLRGVLAINKVKDRKIILADSFEGLPKPDVENFPKDAGVDLSVFPELAVSLEEVQKNFSLYGLLDDQVEFIKGYFSDTLAHVKTEKFALLRLDGDLYESTMVALQYLYPKLSKGGFVIIDDYYALEVCKLAVDEYRREHNIAAPLNEIDGAGVWWRSSLFD